MSRLHPLTPVLRGLRGFGVAIAAISWQGFARLGPTRGAIVVAAFGVVGLVWSWLRWLTTGYEITDGELRVNDGVLTRSRRAIPIDRLQAVDVVQPLLARLAGLAELRLEVAGGGKTEAPLSYLTLGAARDLRRRLLAHAVAVPPEPSADGLITVPTPRLIGAQLLTPHILTLPVALAVTMWLFAIDPDLTLFGIAGTATALLGILFQPVRQALDDFGFTARVAHDGLRVRHGLFERRAQTLPLRRVVAASVKAPLPWRGPGWVRASVASAAYGPGGGREGIAGRTLLPVGSRADARILVAAVLPGVDLDGLSWSPPGGRARWVAPLSWRFLAVSLEETVFAVRSGWLTRVEVVVAYHRIQSVRVTQGRWERLWGVASVHADIAGAPGMVARARGREAGAAVRLARDLIRRSAPASSAALPGASPAEPAPPLEPAPPAEPLP